MIIASSLLDWLIKLLLQVLRRHLKYIGRTMADIVGIPPGICTKKIHLERNWRFKCLILAKIDPPMQEVVKSDIIETIVI